jgi:crossover junction endodeoxyribonuclease RuvC
MLVLGIDPGTATTGFGLIKMTDSGTPVLVHHGLIETKDEGNPGARLVKIYNQLIQLIEEHKPHVVAMEKIFFFINKKTVIRVSQAQGILLMAAANCGVPVHEYAPGQVKLNIGGHGKADKKEMQAAIFKMFGLEAQKNKKTHFDNAADAIAIAVCHGKIATGQQVFPEKKSKAKKKTVVPQNHVTS